MKKLTNINCVIELIFLPFACLGALFSFFLFDDWNSGTRDFFIILISAPVILVISLLWTRRLSKNKNYKMSFWVSFAPAVVIILFLLFIVLPAFLSP